MRDLISLKLDWVSLNCTTVFRADTLGHSRCFLHSRGLSARGKTALFFVSFEAWGEGSVLNGLVVRTVTWEIWILSVWCESMTPTWTRMREHHAHSLWPSLTLYDPFHFGFLSLEWLSINSIIMCAQCKWLVVRALLGCEMWGLNVYRLRMTLNPSLSLDESNRH